MLLSAPPPPSKMTFPFASFAIRAFLGELQVLYSTSIERAG